MMGWLLTETVALLHVMMALNYKVTTLENVGFGGAEQVGLDMKLCALSVEVCTFVALQVLKNK